MRGSTAMCLRHHRSVARRIASFDPPRDAIEVYLVRGSTSEQSNRPTYRLQITAASPPQSESRLIAIILAAV